jgi:tetratricopeptide (TPR) repeat protein
LGLCLTIGMARAEDVNDWFGQARSAYDRQAYPEAIAFYKMILDAGRELPEVYYNLGNAYYKAGEIGLAMAAYQRAIKIAPQDEDILYNIQFLRARLGVQPDQDGPLAKMLKGLWSALPWKTLRAITWTIFILLCALLGRSAWFGGWHRGGLGWSLAAGVMFLCLAGWTAARYYQEEQQRWAVVIAEQVEARNGPGADFPVGFTAPRGREVRWLSREGDWVAIGLVPEGYKGWVKREEILGNHQPMP